MAREEVHHQGRFVEQYAEERDYLIPVEEFARQKGMTVLEVIDHIVNDGATYRGLQDRQGAWLVDRRSPCDQWWRAARSEEGAMPLSRNVQDSAPDAPGQPVTQAIMPTGASLASPNPCTFLTRLLSRR